MSDNEKNIESPCVRNCCLNEHNICLGCFRSLEEICNWSRADSRLRQQFLLNAERRRRHYDQTQAGACISKTHSE
ncbi:DUF1289 domain-containing protein [Methylomonas sp. LL1]|nr:DUF1289 domain-containing protein [Methylomonas sp. LL1]